MLIMDFLFVYLFYGNIKEESREC